MRFSILTPYMRSKAGFLDFCEKFRHLKNDLFLDFEKMLSKVKFCAKYKRSKKLNHNLSVLRDIDIC
jgi:hypothetical protein